MILDTATRSARIVLGEAVTTTAPTVCAFWADQTSGTGGFLPGDTNTATNGTTPVTIVAAPGAGVQRAVTEIRCYNADTVTHTVILQLDDNGTIYVIESTSVPAGGTYSYFTGSPGSAVSTGVTSFNTRAGAVTLLLSDVTGVGGAPIASPAFTGTPTAPTASPGTSTTQIASTAFVAAAVAAGPAAATNYVDNSGFTVNQRSYTTGTALAVGIYGFDRWKGGPSAGGTLTFTATPAATTVNISAGSIQQVIEGLNLLSAAYTLSWSGTATGRIATTSGGGSYAASPVAFTATAGTNAFIEFTGGTLTRVELVLGTVAPIWQPLRAQEELANCQRDFFAWSGAFNISTYAPVAGTTAYGGFWFPVQMRAIPTIGGLSFGAGANVASQNVSVASVNQALFFASATAAGTVLAQLTAAQFSAEL